MEIIRKYRGLLSVWIFIGVVSGLASPYFVTPVYVGTAAIKIGAIGILPVKQSKQPDGTINFHYYAPIENPADLAGVLTARHQVAEAKKNLIDLPYVVDVQKLSKNVIKLIVRGRSEAELTQFLIEVLTWTIDRHDKIVQKALNNLEQQRQYYDNYFVESLTKLSNYNTNKNDKNLEDPRDSFIQQSSINMLETIKQINYARSSLATQPTEIILQPKVRPDRLKPKPLLYFITAILVSLFAFVLNLSLLLLIRLESKKNI